MNEYGIFDMDTTIYTAENAVEAEFATVAEALDAIETRHGGNQRLIVRMIEGRDDDCEDVPDDYPAFDASQLFH